MTLSYNQLKFVLLFPGRTGSTYLIEALDAHPEICAGKEFLGRRYYRDADEELQGIREYLTQPSYFKEFLGRYKDADEELQGVGEYLTQPSYEQYSAIGFKTKLRAVQDPERLAKLLRKVRAHVILMLRRNTVKLAVSSINAERLYAATRWDDPQNWNWNLYDDEHRPPPATIDVLTFSRRLGELESDQCELESYVENLELPTLRLYYEDLLADERATFERVFSFLGVQSKLVQGRALKNTSDDLRETISNFDELRSHYLGTPYEQMFDEVLVPK